MVCSLPNWLILGLFLAAQLPFLSIIGNLKPMNAALNLKFLIGKIVAIEQAQELSLEASYSHMQEEPSVALVAYDSHAPSHSCNLVGMVEDSKAGTSLAEEVEV